MGTSVVNELWTLELDGARRERPLLLTQGQEFGAEISPDGRWLAHVSTEAGPNEIIVRPFPAGSGKWQISTAGGIEPHWSRDGRELFFRNGSTLFRTPIDTRRGFVAGPPERVAAGFRHGDNNRSYSPTPDGLGFIALPGWDVGGNAEQVNLALGWRREVQRQLATQR